MKIYDSRHLEQIFPQLKRVYSFGWLLEKDADPDPVSQFARWFREAVRAKDRKPDAMILSTATKSGRPSARTVLLKGFDQKGFVFFTHYDSAKGRQLRDNPRAEIVFFWPAVERQIRVTGNVRKVTRGESDRYFQSRPRASQLSAWASRQSRLIAGRRVLDERMKSLETRFRGRNIPRPSSWGGYRLVPAGFEFWQGRENRLNDRLRYRKVRGGRWKIERLQP